MSDSAKRQDVRPIGRSTAIRGIDDEIDRAARSEASALVTGDAGVGQALAVARLIHRRSARASASMITLHCAGLPDWLLESELFGHLRGSFTGAFRDKPGMLELATGGTLFVDEVGELGPRMQALLLRFLESGEIQRVGAARAHRRVDVRVVAASSLDLRARIDARAFCADLYGRLSAIRITLPPLALARPHAGHPHAPRVAATCERPRITGPAASRPCVASGGSASAGTRQPPRAL